MDFKFTQEFAKSLDKKDDLARFKQKFLFPQHNGKNVIYFTGNSLGLQPVTAKQALQVELDDWAKYGVEGHFDAKNPWYSYHEMFAESMANLVGAKTNEVVAMNGLTTNLHLLMASFYQPTKSRYKIVCEAKAFPSDMYALETQIKWHDLKTEDALVEVAPREGEHTIRHEDVIAAIEEHSDSIAMVMIGGVNYYTGQLFNMKAITEAAHKVGANCGFDLAHAAGNVKLELHDWNVDFAAWCSYKYLNAGPGSVSGAFVHEKHAKNTSLKRLGGWWGHDKNERFKMEKGFKPMPTAEAWQLSNAPVFAMAIYKASLDIFMEAGFEKLSTKSTQIASYLEFVINTISDTASNVDFEIITPSNPAERGNQISVLTHGSGKELFDKLTDNGIIADWREPNVIRMAPVPLYTSYEDIYDFGVILKNVLNG